MVQVTATKESINPVKHSDKVLVVKRESIADEELRAKVLIGVLSGLLGATLGSIGGYFFHQKRGDIKLPKSLQSKTVVQQPAVVVEKPVVAEKRL